MASKVTIRLSATPEDLPGLTGRVLDRLDSYAFPGEDLYEKAGSYWWTAFRGRVPVGFAGLRVFSKENYGFLCRAGVAPAVRGRGIHRRLISSRVRHARLLGLSQLITYTAVDNVSSSNNLIRAGFQLYDPANPWVSETVLYWLKEL